MSEASSLLPTESLQSQEALAQALDMLRDEIMLFPTNHTVDFAYNIASRIGLGVVAASDPSGDAFKLLDYTRAESQPRFKRLTAVTEEDAPAGTHNEYAKILTVDHATILKPDVLRQDMAAKKVEPKHEGDIELINFFKVAAHEAGHAALSGISRVIKGNPSYSGSMRLTATSVYLANHPEIGFTGNWDTDMAIHEERFAEGYANLVMGEVLRSLGYSKREARKIFSSLKLSTDVQGPPNANQIDYLAAATADTTLAERVVNGRRGQTYPGQLGYEKPPRIPI